MSAGTERLEISTAAVKIVDLRARYEQAKASPDKDVEFYSFWGGIDVGIISGAGQVNICVPGTRDSPFLELCTTVSAELIRSFVPSKFNTIIISPKESAPNAEHSIFIFYNKQELGGYYRYSNFEVPLVIVYGGCIIDVASVRYLQSNTSVLIDLSGDAPKCLQATGSMF